MDFTTLSAIHKGEDSMSNTNEMACFVAGLAIGATAAVLLAPKSGSETRKYLQDKAEEGSEYLTKQVDELANTASEVVERGAKRIKHQRENVASAVAAARDAYREAVETTPSASHS
jgi:gas vesicle protein